MGREGADSSITRTGGLGGSTPEGVPGGSEPLALEGVLGL